MSLAAAAALGLGLGVITGMPLGVINVAIVEAALARRRADAAGLGVGGALADTAHALLAFAGLGRLVTARPELVRGLAIAAAAVIVTYAAIAWRRPAPDTTADAVRTAPRPTGVARAILAGLLLTLPNPGALAAWVAVAAVLWPAATTAEAIAIAVGVGAGSAAWFLTLGRLVARTRPDHPWLRHVPRVAVVALVAIAIAGVARVV